MSMRYTLWNLDPSGHMQMSHVVSRVYESAASILNYPAGDGLSVKRASNLSVEEGAGQDNSWRTGNSRMENQALLQTATALA